MCRAMGALFLQHRVHCLEREVESAQKEKRHDVQGARGVKNQSCPFARGRRSLAAPSADRTSVHVATAQPTTDVGTIPEDVKLVYVVDASVLIYSLRTVHQWLKDASIRIVVPSEALRTLDMLKKGSQQINVAGRKAARFLEERFCCPSSPAQKAKEDSKPGLWLQQDKEHLDLQDAELLRITPTPRVHVPGRDAPLAERLLLSDAPVHVRESLLCGLWHQQSKGPSNCIPKFAYVIAFAPPSLSDQTYDSAPARRADPRYLVPWAKAYGLYPSAEATAEDEPFANLKIVPTASSWLQLAPVSRSRDTSDESGSNSANGSGTVCLRPSRNARCRDSRIH